MLWIHLPLIYTCLRFPYQHAAVVSSALSIAVDFVTEKFKIATTAKHCEHDEEMWNKIFAKTRDVLEPYMNNHWSVPFRLSFLCGSEIQGHCQHRILFNKFLRSWFYQKLHELRGHPLVCLVLIFIELQVYNVITY